MTNIKPYCTCEHHSHFNDCERTPHGNPGHDYGREFVPNALVAVRTPHGVYHVCPDCANDCYEHLPRVSGGEAEGA